MRRATCFLFFLLLLILKSSGVLRVEALVRVRETGLHVVIHDDANSKTFSEADSYCQSTYGTRLASVHDTDALTDIWTKFYEAYCDDYSDLSAWMGGQEATLDANDWYWIDGTTWYAMTYTYTAHIMYLHIIVI